MTRYMIAFVAQAGGAGAIAPVIKLLQKKLNVITLAKGPACKWFEKENIEYLEYPDFDETKLKDTIAENGKPSLIITSATCLPHVDMVENLLRGWARENKIPCLSVLDQWQNYAIRFSDLNGDIKYLPDKIAVMDELAKKEAAAEGIPEDIMIITGHPHLEEISKMKDNPEVRKAAAKLREKYKIAAKSKVILFALEALRRNWGEELGYNEATILKELLNIMNKISNKNLALIIKYHPRNIDEDLELLKREIEDARNHFNIIIMKNEDSLSCIEASDIVVGMSSLFLVESVILGKPTLSVQIGAKRKDLFVGTKTGAIPLIETQKQLEEILPRILNDEKYRGEYLKTQQKFSYSHENAAENIAKLALEMAR